MNPKTLQVSLQVFFCSPGTAIDLAFFVRLEYTETRRRRKCRTEGDEFMSDATTLFDQRLGRYQAAIALEPTDRIPIAAGSNYFAEIYSGNTNQEIIYDTDKWLQSEEAFVRAFPATDVLRTGRIYGPLHDALGVKTYRLPGRDLEATGQFQFVETVNMLPDEYDLLIDSPAKFMVENCSPGSSANWGKSRPGRTWPSLKPVWPRPPWGPLCAQRRCTCKTLTACRSR